MSDGSPLVPSSASPHDNPHTNIDVNVFVSERGNEFMRDIAAVFAEAATQLGRRATVVSNRLPEPDGSINLVIAPHEFFVLSDEPVASLKRAAAASVSICTEQPNTPWFHLSLDACQRGLLAFDINAHGTAALQQFGVNAHRLPFGAVPSMSDGWSADAAPARDIDVLFMGGLDPRRGRALAGLAPILWDRHSELRLFPFDKPVTAHSPGVVFGAAKYDLLRRAKLLVNVHRDRSTHLPPGTTPPAYFEWVRMVETMANGCVVVTEASEGFEPLVAGAHFVEADVGDMRDAVAELLGDPDRIEAISHAARTAVTVELPLVASLAPALELIEATVLPNLDRHIADGGHARGTWRLREGGAEGPKRLHAFRPYASILGRAKTIVLGENDTLRRLEAVHALLQHSTEQHIHRTETPAYGASLVGEPPEVSVMVTLYDYETLVAETLDSILASVGVSIEVIIVEDHATDNSREVALGYLSDHPDVPMVLLAKDANEGLAAARNTGIAACRAELVMVMDADNLVYPTCLRRLADALISDTGAAFAYSALERFGAEAGLVSAYAWNPEWLCAANYIDAQTMLRRSVLVELGGYRLGDPLVFGWEDWEMWLRLASRGDRGVLVPEVLGRYRVQSGSMIGVTNLAVDESLAHLRTLHPALPWPMSSS